MISEGYKSAYQQGYSDAMHNFRKEQNTGKWIPVSEGPPKDNRTVIASTEYGVYPEARYSKENGWEWAYESGADYWTTLECVTAWMPLPEPYKAEREE